MGKAYRVLRMPFLDVKKCGDSALTPKTACAFPNSS